MRPSPFLDPEPTITPDTLTILHLRRDHQLPLIPTSTSTDPDAAPLATNTRFGTFPHHTLLGVPWGTQIAASAPACGRQGGGGKKRKRNGEHDTRAAKQTKHTGDPGAAGAGEQEERPRPAEPTVSSTGEASSPLTPSTATTSGFAYVLSPTPEIWTQALPHRTQVVYTPDYSYVLQRLRVRPGDVVIEAGAGSGSFTHAAARAVFSGWPEARDTGEGPSQSAAAAAEADDVGGGGDVTGRKKRKRRLGKVYSFEYHAPRVSQLRNELRDHSLDGVVEATHRDVYKEGFCIDRPRHPTSVASPPSAQGDSSDPGPHATAIFLDLPAPWLALPHLTRAAPSPLARRTAVRLATFSPCVEQAQRTIAALNSRGWVDIHLAELSHRKLDVRREPRARRMVDVLERLKEVGARSRRTKEEAEAGAAREGNDGETVEGETGNQQQRPGGKMDRRGGRGWETRPWREGRLVIRTEPEIRTHTSYLVFATLPREWSEADEERARKKWPAERTKTGK